MTIQRITNCSNKLGPSLSTPVLVRADGEGTYFGRSFK